VKDTPPLGTAGSADDDEQDEEAVEDAAISTGVPTCYIRPHHGVSVRRGSTCCSL
jgi:hypothetical protein